MAANEPKSLPQSTGTSDSLATLLDQFDFNIYFLLSRLLEQRLARNQITFLLSNFTHYIGCTWSFITLIYVTFIADDKALNT
jgi:hypothetical protein